MNKKLFFLGVFTIFVFLSFNLISAQLSDNSCSPKITLVNQDPNPAVPGNYVKLLFQMSDINQNCKGLAVELDPKYPFSFDSNVSSVQTLEQSAYAPDFNTKWDIPYTLRVADDALQGDYNLDLRYHDASNSFDTFSVSQQFNITIQDSRTTFDAVIQAISGNQVSIALANTGKYAANSVVVRIPNQDSFMVSGTDGQMVGNLASGDYTLVSFSILPKNDFSRNMTRNSSSVTSPSNLKFDIYYTDNIGARRIMNMELPLRLSGNSTSTGFGSRTRTTTSSGLNWYAVIIILVVLVIGYFSYKKYPAKFSRLFGDDEDSSSDSPSNKIPDWVSGSKTRERKR